MWSIASTRWGSELPLVLLLSAPCALAMVCTPSPDAEGGLSEKALAKEAPAPAARVATFPEAGANGWRAFRGTPRHSGRADVRGPREAHLAWTFATSGRVSADVAVTADGRTIYAASHDGRLYALSADGKERWSFDTGGAIWTSPAIGPSGAVYVGTDADAIIAVDSDGLALWRLSTALPALKDKPEAGRYDADVSPVVLANGDVVAGAGPRLLAAKPDTGALAWSFEPGQGAEKVFSSPALGDDGTLYFGTQGDRFYAIDRTARVLWTIDAGGDIDSTASLGDDDTVFFAADDGFVRAVAPGGALKWRTSLGGPIRAPLAIARDGSPLASTYGEEPFLAALDAATGEVKWRFHIEPGEGAFYGIESGALVDAEGFVYFGGRDGFVYCLSPGGELVWKHRAADQIDASPVLGPDGTLYVGCDDGKVYAFAR